MINKMKGYRKVFICIFAFVWAAIVGLMFKESNVIIPIYSFGSSIVLYLFAANYGEHREENRNGR